MLEGMLLTQYQARYAYLTCDAALLLSVTPVCKNHLSHSYYKLNSKLVFKDPSPTKGVFSLRGKRSEVTLRSDKQNVVLP